MERDGSFVDGEGMSKGLVFYAEGVGGCLEVGRQCRMGTRLFNV